MGWLSYHRPKGQSDLEHFQEKFGAERTILASATYWENDYRVMYAAVRDNTGPQAGRVWAFVVLQKWSGGYYNYAYKDLDETVAEGWDRAPAKVLDLLTPTDHEASLQWRAACRHRLSTEEVAKTAAKQVKAGTVIRTSRTIHFADDVDRDTFRYTGTRSVFVADDGTRVRITGWRRLPFTILTPAAA